MLKARLAFLKHLRTIKNHIEGKEDNGKRI